MNPTEAYRACVVEANEKTFSKFGIHGPYEPGSNEHSFWLTQFDDAVNKRAAKA